MDSIDSESFILQDGNPPDIHRIKDIPELKENTEIYISNKEHPLNLEQGVIVKRCHAHYRIKLTSRITAINGACMWIPAHWVEPLPKELKHVEIS